MVEYNSYWVDADGLERGVRRIGQVAGMPKEALTRFESLERGVEGWNGEDDEFYRKSDPPYRQQNESCRMVLTGLEKFLAGLESAVLESLRSVGETHAVVQDRINDAKGNSEKYGNGGSGKR